MIFFYNNISYKKEKIMKNSILKLSVIGIVSLLSINIFAQDYVYKGINEVEATIGMGMNQKENGSNETIVATECYDPANIGKRISAQGCDGLLIVDNDSLRQMVLNDENYADTNIFTGQVTDMSFLFCNYNGVNETFSSKCTQKNPIYSISSWNTGNVVNMQNMFQLSSYNQLLNNWDVSNVKNMSYMFRDSLFNQPLNNWDVSNVKNMSNMLYRSKYNYPLNNWNVNNVTDMKRLFQYSNFNQPLDNWDVSNVTDMSYMFFYAQSFNQDISNWCVSNISNKSHNFDTNSGFENQTQLQPQWGSCP